MAALCNTLDGVYCEHEPLKRLSKWEDVGDVLKDSGVSDSAFGFHLTEIVEHFNPRVLIIERPVHEVEASLERIGLKSDAYCRVLAKRLAKFKQLSWHRREWTDRVFWVNVRAFHNPFTVEHCLKLLVPDCKPDMRKIREFMDLNIQAHMEMVKRTAADRVPDLSNLLGQDVVNEIASVA